MSRYPFEKNKCLWDVASYVSIAHVDCIGYRVTSTLVVLEKAGRTQVELFVPAAYAFNRCIEIVAVPSSMACIIMVGRWSVCTSA